MLPSTTLFAVLAALALVPSPIASVLAHPNHHHHHSHSHNHGKGEVNLRKSINFGPSHSHAKYHVPVLTDVNEELPFRKRSLAGSGSERVDPKDVARSVIQAELMNHDRSNKDNGEGLVAPSAEGASKGDGVEYYIRDDSYTDPRTGVTHIYAKQLINGLEVADGDMNINIDRDGNVLSYGSSFYSGPTPSVDSLSAAPVDSTTPSRICVALRRITEQHARRIEEIQRLLPHLDADQVSSLGHAIAKIFNAAGQFVFGNSIDKLAQIVDHTLQEMGLERAPEQVTSALVHLEHQLANMRNHLPVVCPPTHEELQQLAPLDENNGLPFHSAAKAFLRLLPVLSPDAQQLPSLMEMADKINTHPETRLKPAEAPLEPPVEVISGLPDISAGGVRDGQVRARLVYHQTEEADLALAWKYEADLGDSWYEAYVDAQTLEIVRVVDWASDAPPRITKGGKQKPLPAPSKIQPYTYNVFPFGVNDPSVGNRSVEHAPWDKIASPAGWHAFSDKSNPWSETKIAGMKTGEDGPFNHSSHSAASHNGTWTRFATTAGNNVFAHEDWEGQSNWLNNYRPINSSLAFDFEYGEPDGLRPKEYIDLAVAQLFYTSNMYHDLLYRLGFDEVSGNFQMDNFGKGGRGGDAVIANAQDGSGYNNANFMTPPDGTQPRMRMYVWDTASPYRDGDLEAGIVIHEYSHGLSTRLTGGPMNSGCLGWGEAGGMGEGWGDAMATFIRQIKEHHLSKNETYAMGSWAANRDNGIRNYKYSTDMAINPSTYKTLDKPGYWGVHAIGEVWAEFLFVMEELLVAKHGFSDTLFPPEDPTKPNDYYRHVKSFDSGGRPLPLVPKHGNTLTVQLIVDGMKLQPCRPTFANARDAIIQADKVLTGGENICEIWKAFSSRGLGPDSKLTGNLPWGGGVRTEDFVVPKLCDAKKKPGKHADEE